jgi:lysophospholipase L1-like esterase
MVQGRPHSRLDTNAEGFRDFDLPLHASAPRRLIICMGESSTWGIGSSSRLTTWPHQLHQILTQQDGQFVVFNAGMPGYTIVENLQLLNLRLLKYRPEAVVYMGFRNDVVFYMRALSESTDLNFYPRRLAPIPATAINNLFMRSSLIAAVVSRVGAIVPLDKQNAPGEAEGTDLTERGKQTFLDQIALMKDLCDRHNVKLLWIDQPINYATGSAGPGYRAAAESARSLLHDELAKERIPLLQARTLYDYRQQPMIDDAHFTDAGNRHLASLLAPQIVAELNQPKP